MYILTIKYCDIKCLNIYDERISLPIDFLNSKSPIFCLFKYMKALVCNTKTVTYLLYILTEKGMLILIDGALMFSPPAFGPSDI